MFAIQLENIEREIFDGSLAKYQTRQYFPVKILHYMVYGSQIDIPWLAFNAIIN